MCGITGLVLSKRDRTEAEYAEITRQFTEQLIAAQSRGTDAAGVYILNEKGEHYYYRAPLAAKALVNTPDFQAVLSHVGASTIAIVGHTRAATTGSPLVVDNNHPIYDAPLIGVHNGVIYNHRNLRNQYGAVSDVDSAVILSTIKAHMGDELLTHGIIRQAMREVDGSWAIAVADIRQEQIFLARNDKSPMEMFHGRKQGITFFGSTHSIISAGFDIDIETVSLPAFAVTTLNRVSAKGRQICYTPLMKPKRKTLAIKPTRFRFSPTDSWTYTDTELEDWELAQLGLAEDIYNDS